MARSIKSIERILNPFFPDQSELTELANLLNNQFTGKKAFIWLSSEQHGAADLTALAAWVPNFVSIPPLGTLPSQLAEFKAGQIYPLDLSSIFEGSIVAGMTSPPQRILDLCAAPGGKTIFSYRYFNSSTKIEKFVANELVKSRTKILRENVIKYRLENIEVTAFDPSYFAEFHSEEFDLVVVDAPCSGQSLLGKDKNSDATFHPTMIKKNAMRQRRILANAITAAAPGGHIAYMTCTFSKDENEDVIAWALREFPGITAIPVETHRAYQSSVVEFACYRLWPNQGLGLGGFTCLLKKSSS
ncbi:RsmB/NOP family class I SAM-dependent RNA methyltransferase [bacterium]|nr:RsmB/NOP family class I SAM-dependent RNA methyltransferase [bacterium]